MEKLWFNERDLESAKLVEFLSDLSVKSLLDVGCHASYSYAGKIRKILPRDHSVQYSGMDLLYDDVIDAVVDEYIQDNVCSQKFNQRRWDCVISVSSIEHSGITTYKADDYVKEQVRVFKRLYELADSFVFVTVPYGKKGLVEGQYANITSDVLSQFTEGLDASVSIEFWHNPNSVSGLDWRQVDKEFADMVELEADTMTRCVCIIRINKERKRE